MLSNPTVSTSSNGEFVLLDKCVGDGGSLGWDNKRNIKADFTALSL